MVVYVLSQYHTYGQKGCIISILIMQTLPYTLPSTFNSSMIQVFFPCMQFCCL